MRRCDVIIPVYNAYDCVIACVDSVLEATDFKNAHIILIDDKSPDDRIVPLLEKYKEKNPTKITFLKNKKNLGFVGTVNRGMKYSKNDVLLLNSDTEVPKEWLERIQKCAYSDDAIATVTPLSNNATLASVPKIFTRNELPDGYDLLKMDRIVQKCSMREYPEIPTAHGFCMYIKREALGRVGYFDEDNFGKGYGEENDFSFRCFEFGYRNVLCDDVYVLHKESQSFLDEKVDNGQALAKKHPELKQGLDVWCGFRDIARIGDNIALAIGLAEERPNILMVIHDFSNIGENIGGTTLHILDLISELRKEINFHVLAPEGATYKVHSFFKDTDIVTGIYDKPFLIERIGLHSNTYKKMVEKIIDIYKISFVHIHHIMGHYFDIGQVCEDKKIAYAVSLHDMYFKTPIASMMDEAIVDKIELPINIESWRKASTHLLEKAAKVICPSEFTAKEYKKVFSKIKPEVIPHGIKVKKEEAIIRSDSKKNIAFVGAIFPHKGSEILEKLTARVSANDNLVVHLFGTTIADINKRKNFVNHGPYERNEIGKLLKKNQIDLVCVFSLAPETFSYTVEEVIAAGVPVLTFDIGASAERINENKIGWVIKYTKDEEKVLENIKNILRNEGEYKEIVDNINKYESVNVGEMASEYNGIYAKYIQPKKMIFDILQSELMRVNLVKNVMTKNYKYNYEADYLAIVNSKKWKMISKIKVPKKMRAVMKKIYYLVKG